MRESLGATKPKGGVKAKAAPAVLGGIPRLVAGAHHRPVWNFHAEVRRSKSVHVGTRKMVNYA